MSSWRDFLIAADSHQPAGLDPASISILESIYFGPSDVDFWGKGKLLFFGDLYHLTFWV